MPPTSRRGTLYYSTYSTRMLLLLIVVKRQTYSHVKSQNSHRKKMGNNQKQAYLVHFHLKTGTCSNPVYKNPHQPRDWPNGHRGGSSATSFSSMPFQLHSYFTLCDRYAQLGTFVCTFVEGRTNHASYTPGIRYHIPWYTCITAACCTTLVGYETTIR